MIRTINGKNLNSSHDVNANTRLRSVPSRVTTCTRTVTSQNHPLGIGSISRLAEFSSRKLVAWAILDLLFDLDGGDESLLHRHEGVALFGQMGYFD